MGDERQPDAMDDVSARIIADLESAARRAPARYIEDRDSVLWLMCLVGTIVLARFRMWPTANIGSVAGIYVGAFVVVFLIGFIFAKIAIALTRRTPLVGRTGFAIAVMLMIVAAWRARGALDARSPQGVESTGIASPSLPPAPHAQSSVERVDAFVATLQKRTDRYVSEINVAGEGMYDADRMTTAAGIDAMHAATSKMRRQHLGYAGDVRRAFRRLELSLSPKLLKAPSAQRLSPPPTTSIDLPATSPAATLDGQLLRVQAAIEQVLSIDENTFPLVDQLADLLQSHLGAMDVKDGKLKFATPADRDAFAGVVQGVQANKVKDTEAQKELDNQIAALRTLVAATPKE